jgi:hypothetical protein
MSNTTTSPHVDAVRQAVKEFERVQFSLREFGAQDTEPDGMFQSRVSRAARGLRPAAPQGVVGWELFHMPGADGAARKLTADCSAVINAIEACPISEQAELQGYVSDYCWRVY